MSIQFPNTIIKITADGRTVASDSLDPGERLVSGVTYEQFASGDFEAGRDLPEREIPPLIAVKNPAPSSVLTTDETGVHTRLTTPEGDLIARLSPLEIRAAEAEAIQVSEDPEEQPKARASRAKVTDSAEPVADAGDAPEA